MNNREYVQSLGIDKTRQQKCLAVMEKYGNNHWWEPEVDQLTFAYYQINEDIMLCPNFHTFHTAAEKLLGRPIFSHEFGLSMDMLRREAERAWRERA